MKKCRPSLLQPLYNTLIPMERKKRMVQFANKKYYEKFHKRKKKLKTYVLLQNNQPITQAESKEKIPTEFLKLHVRMFNRLNRTEYEFLDVFTLSIYIYIYIYGGISKYEVSVLFNQTRLISNVVPRHTHTWASTQTHTYKQTHTHTHTHIYIYVYIYIYIYLVTNIVKIASPRNNHSRVVMP